MPPQEKNVAILGSTGSIGRNTLEVIDASAGRLRAIAQLGDVAYLQTKLDD